VSRKIIILAAVLALFASCASFQEASDRGNSAALVELINAGKSAQLASRSTVPFLVDGEIVNLRSDVATFWEGIAKAGFRIEGAQLERGIPLTADSYKLFADTMEAKSFFAQYVTKDARILSLITAKGEHILLIYKEAFFSKHLYGFKGPF
jgi:hypothetical protein